MKYAKVTFQHAQSLKNKILNLGIFSNEYPVLKDKSYVYFPVTKKIKGFVVVEKKIKKKVIALKPYEILRSKLSKKDFKILTKSYDVVGDIAILELNDLIVKNKKIIAGAFLSNKNIHTVVRKLGEHRGKYRIQKYEFLVGKKTFRTLHKENGISINLNINETYYSPRLSNERLRISKQIKNGEDVLVMFSGVGVYPLVIAKNSNPGLIYGIEINPKACKYAEDNIKLNKFNNIKLFCGDVLKLVPKIKYKFDRIIMPLPKDSLNFLDIALSVLKKEGVIHLYCFSSQDELNIILDKIKQMCNCRIIKIVKTGQQSPKIYRFCIDFKVQ